MIQSVSSEEAYDVETLVGNLQLVLERVEREHETSGQFDRLYYHLIKLIDHINLEVARCQVDSTHERQLQHLCEEFTDSKSKLSAANQELLDARKELEAVNTKVENSISQLVSVLSIFAAIVIAVSGGVNFLGNSISSIQNVIIYKSMLVCLLCGLLLFNTVFLMLYIVGKIINRSIFSHCDEECRDHSSGKSICNCASSCSCSTISRLRKRLPYVFWVNAVGLGLCVVDVILWYCRLRSLFPFNF